VRVLGLDDFAMRRGDRYGTILVNLETGKPLDLLPDREASAVFPWLEKHQEIDVVSRDRASAYADAVKRALPHATQVADRYHLIQNLREHVQRFLDRKRTWLPEVEDIPLKEASTGSPGSGESLNNHTGTLTSPVSAGRSQAERTDQPEAQVEPELPNALVGQEIELASLTYAERKKKISALPHQKSYSAVCSTGRGQELLAGFSVTRLAGVMGHGSLRFAIAPRAFPRGELVFSACLGSRVRICNG
jgi:hypothetical protein